LFRREEVIYTRRGEVGKVIILRVPCVGVAVEVVIRDPGGVLRNLIVYAEDCLRDRIQLRRQSPRCGEIQHVGCPKLIGSAVYQVSIDALLSVRGQYRDSAGSLHRRIGLLEVDKGEQLILEVPKGNQRPAEISSIVVSAIESSLQSLRVSGPTVGVEPLACWLVEGAAVVLSAAAPRCELDIRAALCAGVRAQAAGLHRYLIDRSQTHRNGHEKD